MYAYKGDFITESIKHWGATTRCEMAMVLSLLSSGDTVIDVGAHIGSYSLAFATKVGSQGKVFAFEGLPMHFEVLQRNIALNNLTRTITAQSAVISDRSENYKFLLNLQNTGDCMFLPQNDLSRTTFQGLTLDEWYVKNQPGKVRLIKTDTEGMELAVLKGARQLICQQRPIIYCEIHTQHLREHATNPEQVGNYLRELGYLFYRNICDRDAAHDNFIVQRFEKMEEARVFFDLLAVHADEAVSLG